MKWRRYPKYKDSGIKWLEEVPVYWNVAPLKRAVDPNRPITYGIVQCGEDVTDGIPYIRPVDMTDEGGVSFEKIRRTAPEIAAAYSRSMLASDDLVVSIGPSFGKVMIVPSELAGANLTQGTARIAPARGVNLRYLFWLLRSRNLNEAWDSVATGATFRALNLEPLSRTQICIPPEEEQPQIATFLDRETARIDALIETKQRQIELLQEKRAALISHAVTKGLDPNVKMKDSGIEWLGQVPEHWDVLPLRRVIHRFIDYRGKTPTKTESGIPLITAGAIKDGIIDHSLVPEYIAEDDYDEWMTRGLPEIGDVLLTTEAPLGEVALINDPEIALAQRIILLKVDPKYMNSTYLRYYYLADEGRSELLSRASGSTASGIRSDRLRMSLVLVPPIEDQLAVTQFLDAELATLMRPFALIEASIEKLHEYRTALISAAVTGKIDVREEAA